MRTKIMRRAFFLTMMISLLTMVSSAWALEPDKNGWFHTGDSLRVKKIAFVNIKVYAIRHDMKQLPPAKSKQAVIDIDTDKKFTWMMLRDVPCEKIQGALKDAFEMNGFKDAGKINQFVGACNVEELKEKSAVQITYSAEKKATTIWFQNGGSATIPGVDFMKAVWSIWFGKIDPPSIGDELIGKI